VSIVVPAFREGPNIRPLTQRVFAALAAEGIEGELIIVDDDSRDGTEEAVAELAGAYPVRLIVRREERGLSGAVLRGFEEAGHEVLVVLDGDLQHPPEAIPAVVAKMDSGCDFVIATRYAEGGSLAENWPWHRRMMSRIAGLLARPLTPLSDPMSGFFAVRRDAVRAATGLSPLGFKIALEVYVKAGCRRPGEVPIAFGTRAAGESKLGAGEVGRYLKHLHRLYRHRWPVVWWMVPTATLLVLIVGVFAVARQIIR
jgi:dolichol-phosphate mannosyltransferase